jgi:signal transduction histidine kinase
MQDFRAIPRWSKATVVVVMVVFTLVLIVTAFALWGLDSYRENVRNDERARADLDAKRALEETRQQIDGRIDWLLNRAARGRGPEHLKSLRASDPLVDELFFLDEEGVFRWVDPAWRLEAPLDWIEATSAAQVVDEEHLARVAEAKPDGFKATLPLWREAVRKWGLATGVLAGRPGRTSRGLVLTVAMLANASAVVDEDPGHLPAAELREILLSALEQEALWSERRDVRLLPEMMRRVGRQIAAYIEALPDDVRDDLEWEARRFRHYRDLLEDRVLLETLKGAVSALERDDIEGRFVLHTRPELLGVSRDPRGRQHTHTLVVRLDRDAVGNLVAANIEASRFVELGGHAAVFPLEVAPRHEGRPETCVVPLSDRPFELPFRLAFFRTGDPLSRTTGITDALLWVLIGLAVAGIGVGGYALVRLLTREIRVARLKADFVSNISHELKTPITSISLFTEMLDEGKLTDPEEQAEAFSVLAAEAQRLQQIVGRMLTVARGEARRNPYELRLGDLNEVVAEATGRFRRITTDPGLELEEDFYPGTLPVQMDRQAMDDVVTNLLSNAWKYKRGDRVHITVRSARRGRFAEVLVSDDGVGIPREERRRVFEMFYRADQLLTGEVPGTGLGLALVRSAVREHRGSVRVEAGPGGRGAAFRLRFPLDLMGVAAEEAATGGVSTPADTAGPGRGTVGAPSPAADEVARSAAGRPGAKS